MDSKLVGHEGSDGLPEGMDGFCIGFAFRPEQSSQSLPGPDTARTFKAGHGKGRGAQTRNLRCFTVLAVSGVMG